MRRHKKAGVTRLLALGSVFLAGAYVQNCTDLTAKVEDTVKGASERIMNINIAAQSDAYQRVISTQPITGFENDVYQTVVMGLERLPDSYQERSVAAGLGMLSDSAAYGAMESRIKSLPTDLRTSLFFGTTVNPFGN